MPRWNVIDNVATLYGATVGLILQSPWITATAVVSLSLLAAAVIKALAGRRQARRLNTDVRELLENGDASERLSIEGRSAEFIEIAASLNKLLGQEQENDKSGSGVTPLFEDLAQTLPDVALVHTETILYANDAAANLFGVARESLQGKPVTDLMRPAYRAMVRRQVGAQLDGDPPLQPVEVQLINGDERDLWAELHSRVIDFNGTRALLTVARDISHRKSMEASLGRGKLQARTTLESIGEGVITTDTAGIIDYMNKAAEHLTGASRSSGLGKRLTDLVALVDENDRESLGDPVQKCLNERKRISLGRRALLLSKQGERECSVELTASPIRGPDGTVAGCVIIFHDVTEIRGLTRRMSYQASHDALTGLINRAEFERRLQGALKSARSADGAHVVCYLDLDRFKAVNDTSGHQAGDNLLREIASLLKEKVRDSDTVARLGGDEFGLLLVGCPLDKGRQIADDVCQAVADYRFVRHDRIFDVGVSIGLVEVGHESGSAETVLGAADSACYVAKQQGRGRVHVYSARDEVVARQRGEIQWLQRLQRALKEDRFELFVQPIVSVAGRVREGPAMEVLLRMRDESGELVLPAQFLDSAARYQLMPHIDRWVVQATLTAIASGVLRLPDERSCAINVSGQALGDEDFLEFVVETLDHSGVSPSQLCFEVPESEVVTNLDRAQRFINVLHGIGCRFALDNFGSGIGSFSNLKQLSVDYLKIDGAYIHDLATDSVNRAMVTAMIKLARTLDFQVVAAQVEDQASFDAVRRMGIDFAQGNIVERPHALQSIH
jgi:diguanylate cyclase (GGDEF)-like protein/PAS domain S-box-containing protein